MTGESEWETLAVDTDYEISKIYPYEIRRKSNKYIVHKCLSSYGYYQVKLNGVKYMFHRVVAIQWIPNPMNLEQVDHISKNKTDNRVINLRWCTKSENMRNRLSNNGFNYELVDEINEDAIEVLNYNDHEFEDYYYYDNTFYFWTGIEFRVLPLHQQSKNSYYVNMKNKQGKTVMIYLSKFKRQYDLV